MQTAAMTRHTDGLWSALAAKDASRPAPGGLWSALAAAVRDADEDTATSRRRLAALRLHRAYANSGDLD
jgi:hypothetical protein